MNYVKINLDRPVELEECFMRDVTQLDFWDPWSSHMSGGEKKGKAYEQRNSIPIIKHGGAPVLSSGDLDLEWLVQSSDLNLI